MKHLIASLSLAMAGSAFAGERPVIQPPRTIDLDAPGVLEVLKRDNPAHFAKVRRILQEAPHRPLPSVEGWIRVQFSANDVAAPLMIRTSYPAQWRLSFVLDDIRYVTIVRLAKLDPTLNPPK